MSLRKDYNLSTTSLCTPIRNTSTPFPSRRRSILSSKPNSVLTRRYSLSDVDYLTPIQKNSKLLNQRNVSNLVKSPINPKKSAENKDKILLNHQQMKYSIAGVFPIVHLDKKDLPVLKEKSKHNVTVRLASPDLFQHNSPEHNRLLLEKVIQNSPKPVSATITTSTPTTTTTTATMTNRNIEISTRSVLDALKEISRKRIHTNDEYLDDGKRIRLEHNNNDLVVNKKRQRGDSPPYEQNSKSLKKACSFNEILASKSSTRIKVVQETSTISPATITQKNKQSDDDDDSREIQPAKKANLVSVETQTVTTESFKEVGVQSVLPTPIAIETDNKENVEKTTETPTTSVEITTTVKSSACLKVFDEAPLERTRKDRLSVLMGIKRKPTDITTNHEEKPIMSILSNNINKNLKAATPKHVTFNLETEPEATQEQTTIAVPTVTTTTTSPIVSSVPITQTTASITMPLISSVVSEIPKLPDKVDTKETITKDATVSLNPVTTSETVVPTFNFITSKPETISEVKPTTAPTTTSNLFANLKPANLVTVAPTTTVATITTTTSSPPKIGGFKFDLQPKVGGFTLPTTTATTLTQKPTFFFAGTTTTATTGSNSRTITTASSFTAPPKFSLSSSQPAKFNFTATTTTPITTTSQSLSFTQSGRTFGSVGGFSFTTPPQTTQSFVSPNPVVATTTVAPVLATNTFGLQSTQSIFGSNPVITTTTATSTFGVQQTTTTNVFGSTFGSTGSFNFGGNQTVEKPTFGTVPSTQPNLFTTTTTTVTTTTTTNIFTTNVFSSSNAAATNTATSQINPPTQPPAFGNTNSTNIFGGTAFNPTPIVPQQSSTTPAQNPAPFGNVFDTNKSTFGGTSSGFNTTFGSNSFGTATTNPSNPIVFGGNISTNTGGFSTNPLPPPAAAAGAAASPPPSSIFTFGANANKTTGIFSFGQSEPPKSTFNFAATTGGSSSTSSGAGFGTNNTSNPVGTPQFNPPPVAGAMFNIGSGGSSTPRSRTQLKAKRRT